MTVAGPAYDDPRDGFRWRADRHAWRDFAACQGAPPDLFFAEDADGTEPAYPTEEQKSYCDRCLVKDDCYEEGCEEEYGVWGATTAYQRRLLGRVLSRRRCPVCSVFAVVAQHPHELCTACGHSWRAPVVGA